MKKIIINLMLMLLLVVNLHGQKQLSLSAGYSGTVLLANGGMLGLEYQKQHSEYFSLPLIFQGGYQSNADLNGISFEVHKGFRKSFRSGLIVEQFLGVGSIGKKYNNGLPYYYDKHMGISFHGGTRVWGIMPSASIGAGYSLEGRNGNSTMLWLRPKVYWDLGFRGLNIPYLSLQFGFTQTFKNF